MRLTEILLSVPNLLLVVLLQAILGTANVLTLSLVIGLTSWASIAKVVRTEVRRLRSSEYVLASRCMGGELLPRPAAATLRRISLSSIIVHGRYEHPQRHHGGIDAELPRHRPADRGRSRGAACFPSSEKALLTDAWWIIIIPGVFLVATLLCITELANAMRRSARERTL